VDQRYGVEVEKMPFAQEFLFALDVGWPEFDRKKTYLRKPLKILKVEDKIFELNKKSYLHNDA
jgi:hypothetical protein